MIRKILFVFIFCIISFQLSVAGFSQVNDESTDILVIGAGQSGIMSAIQAARLGSKVILISSHDWMGGSMTEAGVSAIDGNELKAFQTGLWQEFLNRLAEKENNLLKYGWVSLFTFNPKIGNQVFKDWVAEEKNIKVLYSLKPTEVLFDNSEKYPKVIGVKFSSESGKIITIKAKVTIEASEFGDLLKIGKIPHRLGWEYAGEFKEPSAPIKKSKLIIRYPLQELTWAFYIKDYGIGQKAPLIPAPSGYTYEKAASRYWCAFKNEKLIKKSQSESRFSLNPNSIDWAGKYKSAEKYSSFFSPESFLTYGQVSPELFMINWPKCGNDYSLGIERIFSDKVAEREQFFKEAQVYSLWFAKYIQDTFGERFGLATEVFPANSLNNKIGGLAYIPYNREVLRLEGFKTLTENDILPDLKNGEQARYLPDSIAIGNYANDHHYFEMAKPNSDKYFKLAPKSIQWGGRYTGTGFSIPYSSLLPVKVNGLLVTEKSWSVSHIANGSSRLQPVCLLIGQAAGAAAHLAASQNINPYNINLEDLQNLLLLDKQAPSALITLYDLKSNYPARAAIEKLILAGIIDFPKDGNFKPNEIISESDFEKWTQKANLKEKLNFSNNLTRGEIAAVIAQAKWKNLFVDKQQPQAKIPKYQWQKYCATLKQGGNAKSFKLEYPKDENDKSITRQMPFSSNIANTAGAITLDPEVYDFMLKNASKNSKICFKGQYNSAGAWMLIDEILE